MTDATKALTEMLAVEMKHWKNPPSNVTLRQRAEVIVEEELSR